MTIDLPVRRADVLAVDMGRETLLQDSRGRAVHVLNETASLVWSLCDGQHSLAGIEAAVRARFAVATGADVRADVAAIVQQFAGQGLLQP